MKTFGFGFSGSNYFSAEYVAMINSFIFEYVNTITGKRYKLYVHTDDIGFILCEYEIFTDEYIQLRVKKDTIEYLKNGIVRRILYVGSDNSSKLKSFIRKVRNEIKEAKWEEGKQYK